jgi:hypothetical protein
MMKEIYFLRSRMTVLRLIVSNGLALQLADAELSLHPG